MSRYTSEIIRQRLSLDYYGFENLYKSIRTSTRFRFESDYLDNQRGVYSIILTAKYFDYFDSINEKIYRYYILTNEKRRELVKIMDQIDYTLRDIEDEECIKHIEQQGYRQIQDFSHDFSLDSSDGIALIELKELEKVLTTPSYNNGPNENHTMYHMDGNSYKILEERSTDNERHFMVLVEKKEVVLSDLRSLVKSIKFKDREIIDKIPLEKRAKDEKSLIYNWVNQIFPNKSVWETVIDISTLTEDEIMIYLSINRHSLLTVQNLNVITEAYGSSKFLLVNT